MPATEQTWRDQRILHRVFGAAGGVLLVATILMFYVDHDREWKHYQDTAREMDLTYNEWLQLQYRSDDAMRKHAELSEELLAARATPVDSDLLASFATEASKDASAKHLLERQKIADAAKAVQTAIDAVASAKDDKAKLAASVKAGAARQKLVDRLNTVIADVRFREVNKLDERKGRSGELDAAKANLDLAVRDNLSAAKQKSLQQEVDGLKANLDKLTLEYQTLSDVRRNLQGIVRQLTVGEDDAAKRVDANQAELKGLQTAFTERSMNYFTGTFPYLGKKWLTLPIADAFGSPRKIENLWSDDLTMYNNFKYVRRFDRCTTCHQSMEKTLPGQPTQGLFDESRIVRLMLPAPAPDVIQQAREEYKSSEDKTQSEEAWLLQKLYGFRLASAGLVSNDDVTVSQVTLGSPAANAELAGTSAQKLTGKELRDSLATGGESGSEASTVSEKPGLAMGDVIQQVNGNLTDRPEKVLRHLLGADVQGKPIELVVRRGFAHPYSSHPRLDLFVGSTSPHKVQTFACTVCHEGQGSATQFKWASHSPDSVRQSEDWARDHGWFDNSHWIFPMYSKRFSEATCLKCHHEVVELAPSEKFPDPPAPKLMHGYDLLRKYGCYGCHEINGYDGPLKRIGPDMRTEPNFFAAALQLKSLLHRADGAAWKSLTADERGWIERVAEHPEDEGSRHRIVEMLSDDAKAETPRFSDETRKLAGALKDAETPGAMRRPGPSLRYAAQKLDDQFMYDWIREPKHFRASSRMPQFFGFRDHLDPASRDTADEFEPVEILGMLTYLRERSQEFNFLEKPQVKEPSAENDEARAAARVARGKSQFEQRGCLACHSHDDFPNVKGYRAAGEIVQGPDLTGLGSKFDPKRNPKGADWLYSWIKQPTRYHARTVMPDLFLDPIVEKDEAGAVKSVTDPAADIVAYLLQSTNPNWKPDPAALKSGAGDNLNKLLLLHLEGAFFKDKAKKVAEHGLSPKERNSVKGAEVELIVGEEQAGKPLTEHQKLLYIGAKSINKYGCFGCHDIPGFEEAKPIGTGLADWGRKDPAKLAFEHISHYLDHHGGEGHGAHADHEAGHDAKSESSDDALPDFYKQHILSGHREGFIWQKLAAPRSYDYRKTENKGYNDWLRMPKFPFNADEREALITFVLGLVAEPPTPKYLYKPDPRSVALIEGRKVLDKFNCAGCHVLSPEKWRVSGTDEEIGAQPETETYPFLTPHFTSEELAASTKKDRRGLFTATFSGMPAIDDADARPRVSDDEGLPVEADEQYDPAKVQFPFDLWEPALFAGRMYRVGVLPVNVPAHRIDKRYAAKGGVLSRYLLPVVTRAEKTINPAAKGSESWAWVPPPLLGQGKKTNPQWLHDFLLNPYPIRPAVVLRMPKFNLSSAEATALARYFAAVDEAPYPMESIERRMPAYLTAEQQRYDASREPGAEASGRLDDALKIVVNQNFCVKCHLVGDFEPKGSDRAKAPNLARIHDRLKPGYLREWIANPKQVLPYTAMPINVPYSTGIDPKLKLFHGTSTDQVDGLVDLLMNFDNFSKAKNQITPLVPKDAPKPEGGAPATEAKPAAN